MVGVVILTMIRNSKKLGEGQGAGEEEEKKVGRARRG